MIKSLKKIMLCLMLSAMPFCSPALAGEIPKPDFSCLSSPQKDAINICFDENEACHKSLKATQYSGSSEWNSFLGVFIAGAIAGIVAEFNMRK